jgi:hypothetical protein
MQKPLGLQWLDGIAEFMRILQKSSGFVQFYAQFHTRSLQDLDAFWPHDGAWRIQSLLPYGAELYA